MFTKPKEVGRGGFVVTEQVIDWDAVWGAVIVVGVALVMLKACGG